MKKIAKIIFTVFLVILGCYLVVSLGVRSYFGNNSTIELFGAKYTEFDCSGDFVPFYADNCWYSSDVGRHHLFGISVLKTDTDKNFIYYSNALGETVYKKDSYQLPEFPEKNGINKLILSYKAEDITITDKTDIEEILTFLSTHNFPENSERNDSVVIYAVTENPGGVFQLNKPGSIYLENDKLAFGYFDSEYLPDSLQKVIGAYIFAK